MIEVKAQLRHLRMSPKKVRLVADAIKGLPAEDALVRLQFINKAPAQVLAKLVRSALANARHNSNLTDDLMIVKSILVEEGVALKRWKPAAFGSAHPYKKRASHVKLVLGLKDGAKLPKGIESAEKTPKKVGADKEKATVTPEKTPEVKKETVKKTKRSSSSDKPSAKKKMTKDKK